MSESETHLHYLKLANYTRKESIDEMRHAEALIERLLYLDGSPNMSELFTLTIGKTVKEQFQTISRSRSKLSPA